MLNKPAVTGGPPQRQKPFPRWPVFGHEEEDALLEVLHSGNWWQHAADTQCSEVSRFEEAFAARQGAAFGIACANGTAALEVSLKALGIRPGDEVIVPPYTFIATASAVMVLDAVPVFADIDPNTFNIDPAAIEAAITPSTRAIIPVHFAGQAADMETIMSIARRHDLGVIEDAAHGHGAQWNGHGLGSIGDAGTFSFQASKNMTSGEGGLISTNDPTVAELCRSYISLGREPGRPWYEHHRLGWNYRLTEFQAAILSRQLQRLEDQTARRTRNADYLRALLQPIPGIAPLAIPAYVTRHSYHLFIVRYSAEAFGLSRETFLAALQAEGIPCSGGYAHPLYRNPMFLNCGVDYAQYAAKCPHAERACAEAVWLEHRLFLGGAEDMEDIAMAISKIFAHREELRSLAVPSGAA